MPQPPAWLRKNLGLDFPQFSQKNPVSSTVTVTVTVLRVIPTHQHQVTPDKPRLETIKFSSNGWNERRNNHEYVAYCVPCK